MSFELGRVSRTAAGLACAVAVLSTSAPTGALAATTHPSTPTFTIPASARVHGNSNEAPATNTSTQASTAPAASTPGTGTPAAGTPAATTPAATTPPATTAPATTVPPTGATPGTSTPATGAPAGTTTPNNGTAAPASQIHKTEASNTRLSTGALALIVRGALLVLLCLAWVLGRQLALEPRWTVSLMHSLREAGYRGSATWAEFTDWSRLGR